MTTTDGRAAVPDYAAAVEVSGEADALEDLLDDLPGAIMLGPDADGFLRFEFVVEAETSALAMLAASGTLARVNSRLLDKPLMLIVKPAA